MFFGSCCPRRERDNCIASFAFVCVPLEGKFCPWRERDNYCTYFGSFADVRGGRFCPRRERDNYFGSFRVVFAGGFAPEGEGQLVWLILGCFWGTEGE